MNKPEKPSLFGILHFIIFFTGIFLIGTLSILESVNNQDYLHTFIGIFSFCYFGSIFLILGKGIMDIYKHNNMNETDFNNKMMDTNRRVREKIDKEKGSN